MKFRLWLIAIPIIAAFSLIQATFDWGEQGKLKSTFLRKEIYPLSKNINGIMTNIKFKIRGTQKPDPNIVIVAADDASVENWGVGRGTEKSTHRSSTRFSKWEPTTSRWTSCFQSQKSAFPPTFTRRSRV